MKGVAFYTRVSTTGQTTENQTAELDEVARVRGWNVTHRLTDHGISGAKGRDKRPGYDALLNLVNSGAVDLVSAWSLDRIGRSLSELIQFSEHLRHQNVGLYLHKQGLDTTTPSGRAMFGMLGVFAEFEREMIRERVTAGLARAKSEGKKLGRAPTSMDRLREVEMSLKAGLSVAEVMASLHIRKPTILAVRRQMQ